jgi:hypothetical protein
MRSFLSYSQLSFTRNRVCVGCAMTGGSATTRKLMPLAEMFGRWKG